MTLVHTSSYTPCYHGFFQRISFLPSHARLSPSGFRFFSPPWRGSFQLSLTVLVRYRSWDVFRIRSRCLPHSRPISNGRYSRSLIKSLSIYVYGAITLYGHVHSSTSSTSPTRTLNQELLHHIFTPITRGNSVCPLPFSLDVTNGITICFLFLCLLRCFSSAGSRST